MEAAFEVQISYHLQKVWVIMVSRFSHLMFILSLSYTIVSRHIKLVWCTKSAMKATLPHHNSLYCGVTWSTHPPSFSQHLIKALADFARPDIWEKETTEQLPGESGWLSDTNSVSTDYKYISPFYTIAFAQWSAECSLSWHPAVSRHPSNIVSFQIKIRWKAS